MKIVVTGSKGFIGSRLVPTLLKKGHEVIELDKSDGYDITDWKQIRDITNFDIVIHLAAISFVPDSYDIPREMYTVNILGTLNMLELCRLNDAKMVFTSSYVYGQPKYLPLDEKHPTFTFNPYCHSKLIGEDLCKNFNTDFDVPIIIFRPFNIYGPGQNENFLIPLILKQLKETGKISLKDSRPKRDFIHVDDVVDAYCKAVAYNKIDFEIFNLGSGVSYSVKEIAEMIASNYDNNIQIKFSKKRRQNEILNTVANITKAETMLKWIPTILLEKGISEIINKI